MHELYLEENLVGKYNGANLYRRLYVSSAKSLASGTNTKMIEGLPVPNKIISLSVSHNVSNSTLYEATDTYFRSYIDANGDLYVTQTVGSNVILVTRADVYYVK